MGVLMADVKIERSDYFVAFNTSLFLLMCYAVYYDRVAAYRGPANIHEFFLYAVAILMTIVTIWVFLRRLTYPVWLLGAIQLGILLHFAGAFFPIEGGRLYDAHFLTLRFDKYVHAINAFAGAALAGHLLPAMDGRWRLRLIVIVLATLGGGAIVEIVEYLVTLTLARNGVGNYDNNMQDLIANLVGALLFVFVWQLRSTIVRSIPKRGEKQNSFEEAVLIHSG